MLLSRLNKLLLIFLLFFSFFVSIGYSALNASLSVSGDLVYRVPADIRITGVKISSVANGGLEQYSPKYTKDTASVGLKLPNLNSTVVYEVTIKNNSTKKQMITSIANKVDGNTKISYTYDYKLNTTIEANSTIKILFTYKYTGVTSVPSNQLEENTISFTFLAVETHTITYKLNSGTVSGNPTSYKDNESSFVLKRPTRSGYTFAGWTGTDLSEAIYNVTVDTTKGKDYTFTANWLKNETVNYLNLPVTKNGCTLNDINIRYENGNRLTVFLNITGSPTLVQAPTWSNSDQSDIEWISLGKGSWVRSGRTFNYGANASNLTQLKKYRTHIYITCGGTQAFFQSYNDYVLGSSSYLLNYNDDTGYVETKSSNYLGDEISFSSITNPTKSGYTFVGWSTSYSEPEAIVTSFRVGLTTNIFFGTFIKTSNK